MIMFMKNIIEHLISKLLIKNLGLLAYIKFENIFRWFLYRAQITSIIKQYKIDFVIDVGANEGQFATLIRKYFDGDVYSFEPVSSTFKILENKASNDQRWHVFNFALGSENKTQNIYLSNQSVFNSLLKTNSYCEQQFGENAIARSEESITIKRMDSILNNLIPNIENKRLFLKMDTQGFDLNVFKGLGKYLKNVYAIQTELSLISIYDEMPHWTNNVTVFEEHGFRVAGFFPVNRDGEKVIEYDCLMTRT